MSGCDLGAGLSIRISLHVTLHDHVHVFHRGMLELCSSQFRRSRIILLRRLRISSSGMVAFREKVGIYLHYMALFFIVIQNVRTYLYLCTHAPKCLAEHFERRSDASSR